MNIYLRLVELGCLIGAVCGAFTRRYDVSTLMMACAIYLHLPDKNRD